jgi:hypothetical protein
MSLESIKNIVVAELFGGKIEENKNKENKSEDGRCGDILPKCFKSLF